MIDLLVGVSVIGVGLIFYFWICSLKDQLNDTEEKIQKICPHKIVEPQFGGCFKCIICQKYFLDKSELPKGTRMKVTRYEKVDYKKLKGYGVKK